MAAMLESQITLKLLTWVCRFHPLRDIKVFNMGKLIVNWKIICSIRNYCKIKITKNSIEQKQLVNDSIWKIEIIALKKIKENINDFMIIANFIL